MRTLGKLPEPDWAWIRRVDEMIECYPINKETIKELLEVMPDAYGGTPPGEDDFPEPDRKADEPYKLNKIWTKLSQEAQMDLIAAWEKEYPRNYGD